MSNSGNESDKSGAIPFLLSQGDDSQSSGCDSMYSDEVIRRLEGEDTFMESRFGGQNFGPRTKTMH